MKKLLSALSLFALFAVGIQAQGVKQISLKPGETFTLEAEVPETNAKEVPTLFFTARLESALSVSDNHVLEVAVDGKKLDSVIQDIPRIVNRTGLTFHGTASPYTAKQLWNVAANPIEEYIEIIHVPEDFQDVYVYELDISDVKPGKHTFTWINHDKTRSMLLKSPLVQTCLILKTPYAPLRAFRAEASLQEELVVDADNGKADFRFQFAKGNGRPVLRFRTRLMVGNGWGYNNNLRMDLNGKKIGQTVNGNPRIFNRTNDHFLGDRVHPAMNWRGDYCVFHHASPAVAERVNRFQTADKLQHFWGYLDISDLVKEGENVLTFTNLADSKAFGRSAGNPKLAVEFCEVGYVSEDAMEILPTAAKRTFTNGATVKMPAYQLTIADKTFGIQVRQGNDQFFVDSFLSYPNGDMNSLACKGAQAKKNEESWKPVLTQNGNTITITAQGKYYTLKRELICNDYVIKVRDTIQSLSDEVLGVIYNNYLVSNTSPRRVFKHGACYPNTPWKGTHEAPAANSTMYVELNKGGFGLFVEDDIFKLQCDYTVKGNLLNFKTQHLGFAPRAAHTLEWNLYPRQDGDYFDFINQIREDLGINNQTIPGAILWPGWGGGPNDDRSKYMANLGINIPAIYWFDYDFFRPKDATLEQRLAPCFREYEAYKKANPNCKPIFMWQMNYTRCNYKDLPTFFPDSCEVKADGNMNKSGIGAGWRVGPDGYFTHRYLHEDNSYYRYAMEAIPKMLEKDVLGVYFDTPNHIQKAYSRFTYDRWDNCTVDIDPVTNTVTRKYGDLCLISGNARINVAKLIAKSGKYMYYNNPPVLNELMRLPNCVYMQEGDLDLQLGSLHLAPTPLCFGEHSDYNAPDQPLYHRRKTWLGAQDFMDDICWKIWNGVLYNTYGPPYGKIGEKVSSVVMDHEWPLVYMYPITIMDIHGGWIRGKERLITVKSGTFGWEKESNLKVEFRSFDKEGRAVETKSVTSPNGLFNVTVPDKGMVILIR